MSTVLHHLQEKKTFCMRSPVVCRSFQLCRFDAVSCFGRIKRDIVGWICSHSSEQEKQYMKHVVHGQIRWAQEALYNLLRSIHLVAIERYIAHKTHKVPKMPTLLYWCEGSAVQSQPFVRARRTVRLSHSPTKLRNMYLVYSVPRLGKPASFFEYPSYLLNCI